MKNISIEKAAMKFRYCLLFATFASFMITACNTGNSNKKEKSISHSTNAGNNKDKDTLVLSQTFHNSRYNFSFKLPEGWKAEDRSINGDGFFIKSGWENIDLRAYAEQLLPDTNPNEICTSKSVFIFDDNTRGTFCRDSTEWFFYRIKNDVRLVFYARAEKKLLLKHEEAIKQLAATLRLNSNLGI
ncbi:MAG TPA: hypothetical protein VE912_23240 [Bacteroidales bacterium]|nr:hypothetical protein [Bacteroidales bacterium]